MKTLATIRANCYTRHGDEQGLHLPCCCCLTDQRAQLIAELCVQVTMLDAATWLEGAPPPTSNGGPQSCVVLDRGRGSCRGGVWPGEAVQRASVCRLRACRCPFDAAHGVCAGRVQSACRPVSTRHQSRHLQLLLGAWTRHSTASTRHPEPPAAAPARGAGSYLAGASAAVGRFFAGPGFARCGGAALWYRHRPQHPPWHGGRQTASRGCQARAARALARPHHGRWIWGHWQVRPASRHGRSGHNTSPLPWHLVDLALQSTT